MTVRRSTFAACAVLAWLGIDAGLARPVGAQQANAPHVAYVYPAGGRQGTTVTVRIGGQFLDGVSTVSISGAGVQAQAIDHNKPLNGREQNDLRERMQELQQKGNDPAARKELMQLREQLGESVRRLANPVMSEIVTLSVTVAADAEPGMRSLRLATPAGLTNALVFNVGQLPELAERDVKNSRADAELPIVLPAIVNGRIVPGEIDRIRFPLRQAPQYMPGDVDRYRFHARKGEELVAVVSARDLMPYLADAVPGWFQAVVTLFDDRGHELAYEDDYRFHPDPVLHYTVPADGDYVLEIKDALYRGREDFVYRIAIGELPFVTAMFPLGGPSHARTRVALAGWNLPARALTIDRREPGTYPVSIRKGGLVSNRLPFAVDRLPEVAEREPNDSPRQAQRVSLPAIVNGRIQRAGDSDVFSFRGRAGGEVVAEVQARRLESPLDSAIELTDAAGSRIAFNDDRDDPGSGLLTHHADSMFVATLPKTGTYYVRIGDAQHKGGAEYAYRLRLTAPRPDFELRVTPSIVNATTAANWPVTVHARRRDGFNGDIAIALTGAPAGFSVSGGVVPAGQDRVRITITTPPGVTKEPVRLAFEGRATIAGQAVVHRALPVDEMMQAFAYRHLVPASGDGVAVTLRGGARVAATLLDPLPLGLPEGGTARIRVALPPGYRSFENVKFELNDPPEGIDLADQSLGQGRGEVVFRSDAAKAKTGLRGNLIVTVSGERPATANAAPGRRRVTLGALPAVSFEVVR